MSEIKDENWPQLGANKSIVKITRARYEQAKACVAACAGMENPEQEIAAMRRAYGLVSRMAQNKCLYGKNWCEENVSSSEYYCPSCLARHTLKNL